MRLTTGEQLREMAKLLPRYEVTTENADVFRARIADLEAELAALKAQEPIGWYTDDHLTDKSATIYDWAIAERWDEKGWPLWPLYANPVAQLKAKTAVPEGYRLVAVNDSFSELIYQLDQASENSYLDMVGSLAESWESFDYEYLDNPSTQEGEKQ